MNETFCHALWRDQPTDDNLAEAAPDIVPEGEVRAAIALRFTSSTEPQTRLFWD